MSDRWRYLRSRRRLPTSISSPRREWWSLRCSRRCSVRPLMRAVSSATWTSVEPVSSPPWPCLATMSRLFSAVSVIRTRNRSSRDLTRIGHIEVHLLHQRLDRVEASLPPQALHESDPELLPVEVAVEVDEVRFDEQSPPRLEGRPHPHVHGRRVPARRRGVDAVARADQAVVRDEVRRGHPQLAAAPVAAHHLALEEERPAEELGGLGHLA